MNGHLPARKSGAAAFPSRSPRIALLCATNRGVAFAQRLFAFCPAAEFLVASFPGKPWEPAYLDRLEALTTTAGHRFVKTTRLAATDLFDDGACDLLLAVNWRYLLAPEIYRRARRGAFVFHDSLLPKYRGFSPTVWAMVEGERDTGVTLFEMADPVDSGRIVDQESVPIGPHEYIDSVVARVTDAYLRLLERNLLALLAGTASLRPQDESAATYRPRRNPEDNRIDWRAPAQQIFNLIRATSKPYPGAFCFLGARRITIWKADPPEPLPEELPTGRARPLGASSAREAASNKITSGQIVEVIPGHGARVATSDGLLLLRDVQPENGTIASADTVLPLSALLT